MCIRDSGWDDNGVFNFEGGCYAKVINLDKDSEPDIYNAIKRNALLENVTLDENGKIDFADKSVTENTRVSVSYTHLSPGNITCCSSPAFAQQASQQTSFVTEYSTLLRKKKERTPGHIRTYFAAHARNSAICFSVSGTVGELSSQVFLFSTIKLVSVCLLYTSRCV